MITKPEVKYIRPMGAFGSPIGSLVMVRIILPSNRWPGGEREWYVFESRAQAKKWVKDYLAKKGMQIESKKKSRSP